MVRSLWQRYLRWRLRNVEVVECDDNGLTQYFRKQITHIQWSDIKKIHAFKRDLVTVDCLCLAFITQDGIVEITEDARGYSKVLEQLGNHLGLTSEWMMNVMFPVFEANLTQIYPMAKAE